MKNIFKKAVSSAAAAALILSAGVLPVPAGAEADGEINVLNPENSEFTILTSEGSYDGAEALDENIITTATTKEYNGVPIFDIDGNEGDDYIILMTLEINDKVPMKRFKWNYEYGTKYADNTFYSNGGAAYMNEAVIPWPEGVDIYVSDTGDDGSWTKVYSCGSLEDKLLTEKRPETLWDHSDGLRTYYDLEFDTEVTAKYMRLAIKDVQPWLGPINIPEIKLFADEDDIPQDYKKININAPDCIDAKLVCENAIGDTYGKTGEKITFKAVPDEVSQINYVKLDGENIELNGDGEYSFTMPDKDVDIEIGGGISDYENVPFKLVSASVAGGSFVESDTVPVITFEFNRNAAQLDKTDILVDGKENTGLVQHAFVDAIDKNKVHVAMFGDKLEQGKKYTVSIKELTSAAGIPLEGWAEMSFTTSDDYVVHTEKLVGFVQGYEDGSFRPDNNVTVNEALIMAGRIKEDADFSAVEASDDPASRSDVAEIIYIMMNGGRLDAKQDMFDALVSGGIITGYEDGTYHPEANVTRAEAVTLFNRASDSMKGAEASGEAAKETDGTEETVSDTGFYDVPPEHWAAADIYKAARPDVNTSYDWTENIPEVEYDVYNEKNSIWESVPCVSQEQLDMGISGGEGGQWLQAIECDTEDGQLLFAGVDIGSMIRSTDGGKTWERNYRGFVPKGCVDFEIDPNNKNRVLAIGSLGDIPGNGIYMSEDMGTTWKQVLSYQFNGQRDTRKQLAWDKSSYDEETGGSRIGYWSSMYKIVANNESDNSEWTQPFSDVKGGLYKTEDGGKTWFCVNEAMSDSVVEVNPNDGTVYVGNESGFFRSTDGGVTFDNIITGEPIYGLDVINTRPNNVYINDSRGVMISEDGGKTFTRVEAAGFPVYEDLSDVRNIVRDLAVSPANPDYMLVDARDYINYNNKRYFSHDGGKTWEESRYDTSKDFFFCQNRQHPFAWHPTDENKVWSMGGDWIASSSDGGETFSWDANGYCGTPPGGRVVFNPYNTDYIFGGAQDLLGIFSKDYGHSWIPIEPENGGGFGCSYGSLAMDDNLFVAAIADGWYTERTLKVSRDGGKTWEGDLPLKHGTERRATSFWISPTDPNTAFAGEYMTHDRCDTWEEMQGCLFVLAVNYYHNKELYGLRHNGYDEIIVVSYDNGYTWYPFSETYLDDARALDLTASEFSSGIGPHMWDLKYDGINDILYYMPGNVNTGVTIVRVENNVHTNLGANLIPETVGGYRYMHVMALDPRYPDILYVGTYGCGNTQTMTAIQRSCDRGDTFQVISSMGDPNSIVTDGPAAGSGAETLVVHPVTGDVWLWSVAEGMWKFPAPYENK